MDASMDFIFVGRILGVSFFLCRSYVIDYFENFDI